ncbi:MAG: 16S rRNA (guanine(966)-N(2))-methyltransferase RsmD [Clostridia bacterium]|nr:16S rRNA (guanine(966)-N(2))-methyltransferase RsmD [Clostridia bacterium]
MRVISGLSRGRKLIAPKGLDTRPTTDRVKESMFNLIIPYIPAKNVLDLFAGSGALGIEALSRGSEHCVFVEFGKEALSVVKQNLDLSKQVDKAEVFSLDSLEFLNRTSSSFDLIFLDPPYNKGLLTESIRLIHQKNLLSENGIIVVESEVGGEAPPNDCFKILKQARYGKTTVFVLAHEARR